MPVAQRQDGLVFVYNSFSGAAAAVAGSTNEVDCIRFVCGVYRVRATSILYMKYDRYIVPFTHDHLPHTILSSLSSSA